LSGFIWQSFVRKMPATRAHNSQYCACFVQYKCFVSQC